MRTDGRSNRRFEFRDEARRAIRFSMSVLALLLPVAAAWAQGFTGAEKQLIEQCGSNTLPAGQVVSACNTLLTDPHVLAGSTQASAKLVESVHYNRGVAYDRMGRFAEAIQSYDAALKLNPKDVQALGNRGADRDELHDYPRAIADLTQAIGLDAQELILFIDRGRAYEGTAQYQDALRDYEHAIMLAPQEPVGYFNRGNVYFELGQFDRAIADYSRAVALKPNYAGAYENRGMAYDKIGRRERAAQDHVMAQRLTQAR